MEAEQPMTPPTGTRQTRSDAGSLGRCLDNDGSRSTERIKKRLAWLPSGDSQQARSEHLGKRCLNFALPPAPLMQRLPGGISKQGGRATDKMQGQSQAGPVQTHIWPAAVNLPQAINNSVFYDLCSIE